MDLKKIEVVAARWAEMPESERKEIMPKVQYVMGCIDKALPCLTETDKAAVVDYIAELVTTLQNLHMSQISDVLYSTIVAYGVAAGEYLGWMKVEPEEPGEQG